MVQNVIKESPMIPVPAGGKDTGLKGKSDWITEKKEGICSLWAPARMN